MVTGSPGRVEDQTSRSVREALTRELRNRDLFLPPDQVDAIGASEQVKGERVWARIVKLGMPGGGAGHDRSVSASLVASARLSTVVGFGAATGRLLAGTDPDGASDLEALCGAFNLGISLVDAIYDGGMPRSSRMLETVTAARLLAAAEDPGAAGWLQEAISWPTIDDPLSAFAADTIQAFFRILHTVFGGEERRSLRQHVGTLLVEALAAERQSLCWTVRSADIGELVECSRRKSVLPFEVIDALSAAVTLHAPSGAGTVLGEAAWLIDDLSDLCRDAWSGALNSVLLSVMSFDPADAGVSRVACPGGTPRLDTY